MSDIVIKHRVRTATEHGGINNDTMEFQYHGMKTLLRHVPEDW